MASFQKYKTKKGLLWLIKIVLEDPITKEKFRTTRRGFQSLREAKIAAEKLEEENKNASTLKKSNQLFKDVYLEWFEEQERVLKPSTMKQKLTKFNKWILPHFGALPIGKINKNKCQELEKLWLTSKQGQKILGVSQKTWQTYRDKRLIRYSQVGQKIYVRASWLEEFLEKYKIQEKGE